MIHIKDLIFWFYMTANSTTMLVLCWKAVKRSISFRDSREYRLIKLEENLEQSLSEFHSMIRKLNPDKDNE